MMARAVVLMAVLLAAISLWVAAGPLMGRVFGEATALASNPNPEAPAPQTADLGPVLDFAPFGLAEENALTNSPDEAGNDLTLLGVMMAQSPDLSRAIIAGGDGATPNYGVGDKIRAGVVLTGVFVDHVSLNVGGQDQMLSFPVGNAGVPPMAEPVAQLTGSETPDSRLGRYRAEWLEDAPGVLARLGLEVTKAGYVVTDAATAEVLQAGLRPGDVIGSMNGTELGDVAKDLAAFDQAAALGQANLSVRRNDTTLLMTFPLE